MSLTVLNGKTHTVNSYLLKYAASHTPSLVVDCANVANPHPFHLTEEILSNIFIVQAEVIYKFRDTLKAIPSMRLDVSSIIITTFHRLFHYGDETENNEIFIHAWELMKRLSLTQNVLVGVSDTDQLSQKYCDNRVSLWDTQSGVKELP